MTLRDYQLRAIDMLRARAKDRPLLCLPTGAGKTSVAAEIIRLAVGRGKRCVFLVHRRELVDQAVERLGQFDVRAGRILAGHPEHRARLVQVASIPTLLRRTHWPADVVIVDECAHAVSVSWRKCLDRYAGAFVIGLTATPIRLDGRGLGDLFGCIVEPVSTRELITAGHLVEPRVFAPPVDLRNLRVQAGDYAIPELAARMTKLVGSITGTWQKHTPGQSTVAFAVNVEHSQAIVAAFQAIGVRAEHLDYKMAHKPRARILRDLREGRIDLVSQVCLLAEGWDLPTLQVAILARPTKSLALFRQMVGRIMRPPGPVTVLDHAGNHHEHGPVTVPIAWSLNTPKKREPSTAPAIRTCMECYAVIGPGMTVCPACGAPIPVRDEAEPAKVENPRELVELNMAALTAAKAPERNAPKSEKESAYKRMVQSASWNSRKLGAARHQFKERFGEWPRMWDIEKECYVCPAHVWESAKFGLRCSWCFQAPNVEQRAAFQVEMRERAMESQ